MSQVLSPMRALSTTFAAILLITTIAVTPWMTIDPINLIKLLTLSTGAMAIGALILSNYLNFLYKNALASLVLAVLFVTQLVLAFILSSFDKTLQFFGTMGRNTGLLFYIALIFVLLGGVIISGTPEYRKSIHLITGVGVASAIYGLIQYLDLDPVNWANKYSPIIGFLGNPNFQSSLLGLSAIGALVILLDGSLSIPKRIFSAVFILAALFFVAVSNSQQGLLVFALGFASLAFFKVKALENRAMTYSFLFALVSASLMSLVGFFNKGPLSGVLYQASVTYRGDYWRAGWNMALDNPIFGVGLDAYGDNYRRYRTLEATLRRGPDVISNAAHNVFIDLAANGGFVLLAIYCGFIILALKKVVSYMKFGSRNLYFEGVIAIWIAFLAQSIISINQIGLAVWGWAFTGLILGWQKNLNEVEPRANSKRKPSQLATPKELDAKTFLTAILGLSVGLILSAPPLIASANVKSSMASTQLAKILEAERNWPRDPARSNQIAVILVANSLNKEALEIAMLSTSQFKDNFESWKVLSEVPGVSEDLERVAKLKMKFLDPLNPELK